MVCKLFKLFSALILGTALAVPASADVLVLPGMALVANSSGPAGPPTCC